MGRGMGLGLLSASIALSLSGVVTVPVGVGASGGLLRRDVADLLAVPSQGPRSDDLEGKAASLISTLYQWPDEKGSEPRDVVQQFAKQIQGGPVQTIANDEKKEEKWFNVSETDADIAGLLRNLDNESYLDSEMHKASRWEYMDADQWGRYCAAVYKPFEKELLEKKKFLFLEVGAGLGANARSLLQRFPEAAGVGLDINPSVAEMAAKVMKKYDDRYMTLAADMSQLKRDVPKLMADFEGKFDVILIPGSACYLKTTDLLRQSLKDLGTLLKTGGHMGGNFASAELKDKMSCNIIMPKRFFDEQEPCGFKLVENSYMSSFDAMGAEQKDLGIRDKLERNNFALTKTGQSAEDMARCEQCDFSWLKQPG